MFSRQNHRHSSKTWLYKHWFLLSNCFISYIVNHHASCISQEHWDQACAVIDSRIADRGRSISIRSLIARSHRNRRWMIDSNRPLAIIQSNSEQLADCSKPLDSVQCAQFCGQCGVMSRGSSMAPLYCPADQCKRRAPLLSCQAHPREGKAEDEGQWIRGATPLKCDPGLFSPWTWLKYQFLYPILLPWVLFWLNADQKNDRKKDYKKDRYEQ